MPEHLSYGKALGSGGYSGGGEPPITEGAMDDSCHEYVSCNITDNVSTRRAGGNGYQNKRIINTYYGPRYYSAGM